MKNLASLITVSSNSGFISLLVFSIFSKLASISFTLLSNRELRPFISLCMVGIEFKYSFILSAGKFITLFVDALTNWYPSLSVNPLPSESSSSFFLPFSLSLTSKLKGGIENTLVSLPSTSLFTCIWSWYVPISVNSSVKSSVITNFTFASSVISTSFTLISYPSGLTKVTVAYAPTKFSNKFAGCLSSL